MMCLFHPPNHWQNPINQRLLRHKSQATTEIYLKNIDHDLASAIRLLEKKPTQKYTHNEKEASSHELTP
jgi:hypothetical protein